ncbi:hypothetical protein KR009_011936 [Drosophila setifemur]|nr:hypothetical protein KR009_011936 [Drosophila setifemur]
MICSALLLLPLFVALQTMLITGLSLPLIINEINDRIGITTNLFICTEVDRQDFCELQYRHLNQTITRTIYNSFKSLNATKLRNQLGGDKKLFVVVGNEPPYQLFRQLNLRFQLADFLLVVDNEIDGGKWRSFVDFAWKLGYIKLLIHSTLSGVSYDKLIFPSLRLRATTAKDYANFQDSFGNIHGFPVRVAAYNNVPRSFIYNDNRGKKIYAGYYMRFARAFLESKNATFLPVHPATASPQSCTKAISKNKVDMCADALVRNPLFSVSKEIRIASANVVVAQAQPLKKYRYLAAPFSTSVWLGLILYVIVVVALISLIHWLRRRRWEVSKYSLEVFSSLLYIGFHLKGIHGKGKYLIYGVLLITGFIFSTIYLGILKSMLISEAFDPQIDTFEELANRNIPILIDAYDRALFSKYHLPDILWPMMRTVPSDTLLQHRNSFNQDYAYVIFADRMGMFQHGQQFLKQPKLRPIPIDFCFLFGGFPMKKNWFLKDHLSRAWFNSFESGLIDKLEQDAYRESISQGYLNYTSSESLEPKLLGLDYFVVPAIALALGFALAIISFAIELMVCKICRK